MGGERVIFLVEDDPDTEALVLRALRRAEADPVVVARDGAEALALIAAMPDAPRLVLLDLKIPKIDGFTVLQRIRERFEASAIVVFSSDESPDAVRHATELGATRYAVKPTDYDALDATIRELVHQYGVPGVDARV
ncbi:MAG: response regulator [Fimbriimonadaceae bacterium]|nr:response regulator [Fimbriimonadaceae bacterium]